MGLHIASDSLIAIAYYSIPVALVYMVQKRRDLPFEWMFQLFGAFIIACGTTHLINIWTLWYPNYWISGFIKAVTALVSICTAIALVPLIPKVLALPSPSQLEAANQELEREIVERKQAEAALRQSELRYRAIVEDQTELIARFLPDGTLTFVNSAYCRYFDVALGEIIGHSYQPIILEDDRARVAQCLSMLAPEQPVVTVENRVILPGGIRWTQWINRMLLDQQGQLVEFQAVGRDITEQKQAEEIMVRAHDFYLHLFERFPTPIWRSGLDGQCNYFNQTWLAFTGRTIDQELGDGWIEDIHPNDLDHCVSNYLAAFHARQPFVMEYRLRRHDGVYRCMINYGTPLYNLDDTFAGFIGSCYDISDRKQAEAELQRSQRFIQNVAKTAPVFLYVYDLIEERTVYTNHEITELLNHPANDINTTGDQVQQRLHPDDWIRLQERDRQRQTAQEGDVIQIEYRMRQSDEEWRYFQCMETLFAQTQDGQPQQILGVAVDITDRKQTQQLQAALKEKEVLLQEIHHRVKNNLQIIYSLLRLQHRNVTDPQAAEILQDSRNRVKSIALIHEKLYRSEDLSKIYVDTYIPNLVASLFSSYQLQSDAITLAMSIESISLNIDTAIPCGLIINELVTNSLKYAFVNHPVGEIRVELSLDSERFIHLTIADTGVGIPEQFDFVHPSSLGLKLVKDLVEQLEGQIDIDRGSGTQFRIVFPFNETLAID